MPPTACPTCVADAPVEVAWSLLDPAPRRVVGRPDPARDAPGAAFAGATA